MSKRKKKENRMREIGCRKEGKNGLYHHFTLLFEAGTPTVIDFPGSKIMDSDHHRSSPFRVADRHWLLSTEHK